MNIKQASEQSGVSAPNIRFYEKEGLLTPARRPVSYTHLDVYKRQLMYSIKGVRFSWKIVAIHTSRSTHTPTRLTTMGSKMCIRDRFFQSLIQVCQLDHRERAGGHDDFQLEQFLDLLAVVIFNSLQTGGLLYTSLGAEPAGRLCGRPGAAVGVQHLWQKPARAGERWFAAVSYTHLDVYKRQIPAVSLSVSPARSLWCA